MIIKVEMSGIDDNAIAVILKALKKIASESYSYSGTKNFGIEFGKGKDE